LIQVWPESIKQNNVEIMVMIDLNAG